MIGAVSPAARLTCRIIPVRIPLIEFGRTTAFIVCHRVAPTFQQASLKFIGTDARASRVLAMITGRVIIASVNDAEIIEYPNLAAYTNAPAEERAQCLEHRQDYNHINDSVERLSCVLVGYTASTNGVR